MTEWTPARHAEYQRTIGMIRLSAQRQADDDSSSLLLNSPEGQAFVDSFITEIRRFEESVDGLRAAMEYTQKAVIDFLAAAMVVKQFLAWLDNDPKMRYYARRRIVRLLARRALQPP